MASTRRKAAAVAIAVVGVAGLSLAAAAQLTLDSESLGAGSTIVAACDTDGIDVTYTRAWDAADAEDVTTAVDFANVDTDCAGLDYEVTVLDADDNVIATVSDTVTLSSGAFSAAVDLPTADIEGVALVITG